MLGRYDEALVIHRRVLANRQRLAPDEPLPLEWFDLAESLTDMRRDDEAEPAFRSAIRDAERAYEFSGRNFSCS